METDGAGVSRPQSATSPVAAADPCAVPGCAPGSAARCRWSAKAATDCPSARTRDARAASRARAASWSSCRLRRTSWVGGERRWELELELELGGAPVVSVVVAGVVRWWLHRLVRSSYRVGARVSYERGPGGTSWVMYLDGGTYGPGWLW